MNLKLTTPFSPFSLFSVFLLAILLLLLFIPIAPSLVDQGRDSGIYAYTSKVIVTEGGLPYRDAWDNKPPGIYYINAAAFYLMGVSRWSLWITEWAFIWGTALICLWLLKRLYTRQWLILGVAVIFTLLARQRALVGHGNFTESYALLPQMMCIAFGYLFLQNPTWRWGFLLGLASSVAFLIKQSTMGVALAFVPALIIGGQMTLLKRKDWLYLASMTAGGLLGLGMTAAYLAAHGVLDDAINASFIGASDFHNWTSGRTVHIWETIPATLASGTFMQHFLPFMPLVILAMGITFYRWRKNWPHEQYYPRLYVSFCVWMALTFVADILVLNPTNRAFSHYYITIVPSLVMLMAISLDGLATWSEQFRVQKVRRYQQVWAAVGIYLCVFLGIEAWAHVVKYQQREGYLFGPEVQEKTAEYVQERTQPDDMVFVWGASTDLNFQAERESPTRYHYAYPLIVPGYTQPEDLDILLRDLYTNQPVMILDSAVSDGNRVPPLGAEDRAAWVEDGGRTDTFDLSPLFDFVAEYCVRLGIYDDEAAIYACNYDNLNTNVIRVIRSLRQQWLSAVIDASLFF